MLYFSETFPKHKQNNCSTLKFLEYSKVINKLCLLKIKIIKFHLIKVLRIKYDLLGWLFK
jgi:hypothetical protein